MFCFHTGDPLVINKNSKSILRNDIGKCVELNQDLIRPLKTCISIFVKKVSLEDRVAS